MKEKRTQGKFEQEVKLINPDIEILGKFTSVDDKILCIYNDNTHYMLAYSLLKGRTPNPSSIIWW